MQIASTSISHHGIAVIFWGGRPSLKGGKIEFKVHLRRLNITPNEYLLSKMETRYSFHRDFF